MEKNLIQDVKTLLDTKDITKGYYDYVAIHTMIFGTNYASCMCVKVKLYKKIYDLYKDNKIN